MPITLEDADVRAFFRVLSSLFGAPPRDDAAAHAATRELIQTLIQQVGIMSDHVSQLNAEITRLQSDVAAQTTVIGSATAAFQGLVAQIAAAETAAQNAGATTEQLAAVAAVRESLEANTASLAAAIPQNTPAATDTPAPTPADPNAPAGSEVQL